MYAQLKIMPGFSRAHRIHICNNSCKFMQIQSTFAYISYFKHTAVFTHVGENFL